MGLGKRVLWALVGGMLALAFIQSTIDVAVDARKEAESARVALMECEARPRDVCGG